ncbi:MAG: response regulator [Vulcanimicrobiota bacterium]
MNKQWKILVVDDQVDNLKILELRIRALGYSVMLAQSGIEALEIAKREIPDAVLLDIRMPDIDGFEVCRRLKQDEHLKDIPIIFLTALSDEKALVQGLELGAQDYIVKPFEVQELTARINVALRLRGLQTKLMEENNRLEAILENIPEAIFSVDLDGSILLWNRGAENLTGYLFNDVKNLDYREIIKLFDEKKHAVTELYNLAFPLDNTSRINLEKEDLYLQNKERKLIPVSISFSPVESEGTIASVVVTIQDISRQKEIEKMKEDLLVTISHDLKTPLSAIRGFIEMLLSPKFTSDQEKQTAILNKIKTASVSLLKLINNLLFLYKAGSGYARITCSDFSLGALTDEVVDTFLALAQEKKIELSNTISNDTIVYADREKIEEVFYNLISNAIKFTEDNGKIEIESHAEKERVIISISDTGRGIPEKDRKKIFQKFYQARDSRNGHGLGLYICDTIIKGHGSKFTVESREGSGSRFTFSLRKGKVPPLEQIVERRHKAVVSAHRRKSKHR